MYSQTSVILSTGGSMYGKGGVHVGSMHGGGMCGRGGGHVWQGRGACVAGGGGMCGRGHAWQRACMVVGLVWQG